MFSPTHLFYAISWACNERCTKCHHWQIRPAPKPVPPGLISSAVISLRDVQEFCIVGGEPLLFRQNILEILNSIKGSPCRTVLVTNGVLMDSRFINAVASLNVHIVVSIDTMDPEHWKFVRGRDTLDCVLTNLRYARRTLRQDQLSVQSVLARETEEHIRHVRAMCDELGLYHSVQDYMSEGFGGEWTPLPSHKKRVPDSGVCHAAGRNLSIMPNGDVYTCFQQSWMPRCNVPLGNLNSQQMPDIISSAYATAVQQTMRTCNLPCKVLKCNQ